MYGTVAPGLCPWAGLGVGAGASVYCGHISSFFLIGSVISCSVDLLSMSQCQKSRSSIGWHYKAGFNSNADVHFFFSLVILK